MLEGGKGRNNQQASELLKGDSWGSAVGHRQPQGSEAWVATPTIQKIWANKRRNRRSNLHNFIRNVLVVVGVGCALLWVTMDFT